MSIFQSLMLLCVWNSESIKGAVEANVGVSILSMHYPKELQLKTIHAIKLKPKLTRNFILYACLLKQNTKL